MGFLDRFRPRHHESNPQVIQGKGPIPEFFDLQNNASFLFHETARDLIDRWLEEQGREFHYGYFLKWMEAGNEQGVPEGLYADTNVTQKEYIQSQMLRHAYGSIYISGLVVNGFMQNGQRVITYLSDYVSPEGYAILTFNLPKDVPKPDLPKGWMKKV